MRTSNIQLPTYKELKDILELESKREVETEKINTTYGNFKVILDLLNYFELPTSFFETMKFKDIENIETYNNIVKVFDNVSSKILDSSNEPEVKTLLNRLYDYLSEEDTIQKVDLLFVFGSKSTLRIETAIRLYKEGHAKKIVIAGRGPFYQLHSNQKTEAEVLADFAVGKGIPEEDIILEKTSITVPDNVKASLNLLESSDIPHNSFILVNSPFSQRRGFAHFNKFSKIGTIILRKNTDTVSEKFSKDSWYKNEEGTKTVLKEFFGLRISCLINTG